MFREDKIIIGSDDEDVEQDKINLEILKTKEQDKIKLEILKTKV